MFVHHLNNCDPWATKEIFLRKQSRAQETDYRCRIRCSFYSAGLACRHLHALVIEDSCLCTARMTTITVSNLKHIPAEHIIYGIAIHEARKSHAQTTPPRRVSGRRGLTTSCVTITAAGLLRDMASLPATEDEYDFVEKPSEDFYCPVTFKNPTRQHAVGSISHKRL